MAGTAKMYYVWNFFEKITEEEFIKHWTRTTKHVMTDKDFVSTQLHRNLDHDGFFKYVNHASFDGNDFQIFQEKDTDAVKGLLKTASVAIHVNHIGGYIEIATNTGKPLGPWLPKDDNSVFIVTSFKAADDNDSKLQETFEKDWIETSGANFILQEAPKDLGISHVALYKKITSRHPTAMSYVLRAELKGVGVDSKTARSFLSQLKAFKYPDYFERVNTDLYKPDPEQIVFHAAGKKDLPEGHSYYP